MVNPTQARKLFDAVRAQEPSGPRLAAFYAVMYYAGLRPEEAVSLHRDNVTLPPMIRNEETGEWQEPAPPWGELRFATAAPEVGAEWTDDGQRHDHRHLKARAPGEWRTVPIAPPLVRLLREHLDAYGKGRGGLLFTGVHGGELSSATYRPRLGPRPPSTARTSKTSAASKTRSMKESLLTTIHNVRAFCRQSSAPPLRGGTFAS